MTDETPTLTDDEIETTFTTARPQATTADDTDTSDTGDDTGDDSGDADDSTDTGDDSGDDAA